ncbi:formate/nitrite transporter family protein [Reyranella sp.]|uniref:formate/nitrite transporter family protein n=1 Tax=Reyranella sp. TaxID=1929291 RepID=UPI003BA940E9
MAPSRPPECLSLSPKSPLKTEQEVRDVEERTRLRQPVIYEIVREAGVEELERPFGSMLWSGLAAGLSISFSLLAQAILMLHLPDSTWRPLVVGLGYPVGFLMVILSRQQLFTESTITLVLPVLSRPSRPHLLRLLQVWGLVLGANVAGTLVAAAFCSFTPAVPDEIRTGMLQISRHALDHGWWEMLFRAISAGFLMAALVWLIPSSKGAEFLVIAMMTYLIGVGGFAHIVAGSLEAFMLVLGGELDIGQMLIGFALPTLLGNVFGGTALFALISYAQVAREM